MPGKFNRTFYQQDLVDVINPVRVQPETLGLVIDGVSNSAPTGPASAGAPRAKVSGTRRSSGVNCRKVRLAFTGAVPEGYKTDSVVTVPILTPSFYQSIRPGDPGTYLGVGIEIVGKTPEYVN